MGRDEMAREDALQLQEESNRLLSDDEMAWFIEALEKGLESGDSRIGVGARKLAKDLKNAVKKEHESRRHWHNRDTKRFGKSNRSMSSKWRITAMGMGG